MIYRTDLKTREDYLYCCAPDLDDLSQEIMCVLGDYPGTPLSLFEICAGLGERWEGRLKVLRAIETLTRNGLAVRYDMTLHMIRGHTTGCSFLLGGWTKSDARDISVIRNFEAYQG